MYNTLFFAKIYKTKYWRLQLWDKNAMKCQMNNGNKLRIYFQKPKSVVRLKITDWCLMLSLGLQEVVRHGVIYPNASVLGKQYTVVFVNGVMMTRCLTYFMLWMPRLIMKISVLTLRVSKPISTVQVLKRGCKLRSKSTYRKKSWR